MEKKLVEKKLGARILTKSEMKMVLSTYDKLKEEIESIRKESWEYNLSSDIQNQKTNNIGILGSRGSGKTSIIKTLIEDLKVQDSNYKKDNNLKCGKNIILPIIIPETISENSNIMAIILGLFKPIVEKIKNIYNNQDRKSWQIDKLELEKNMMNC